MPTLAETLEMVHFLQLHCAIYARPSTQGSQEPPSPTGPRSGRAVRGTGPLGGRAQSLRAPVQWPARCSARAALREFIKRLLPGLVPAHTDAEG